MSSTSRGSAITGRPVVERAASRRGSPSAPIPWNESGLVRGLNTQPRRAVAPACAVAIAWSTYRDSTAHGPAMTWTASPPTMASPIDTRLVDGEGPALEMSGSMTTGMSSV